MKVVVIGIATACICFIIMLGVNERHLGEYKTINLNLEGPISGYHDFLKDLRQELKGPLEACGLPVTRDSLPKGNEYLLANLKISDTELVTVALKVNDLYLVAYRVNKKYDGMYRAVFFNEADKDFAMKKLFKDKSTHQVELKYDSNYRSIEIFAGSRDNIPLGYQQLRKKIGEFYSQEEPITGASEAKFLLVAIQMVSEATRYKYVENKVIESGDNGFKPDAKMKDLETSWQKTSDAVRQADKGKTCDSTRITDIKKDTALLKFERKKHSSTNGFDDDEL